MKRRDFITNTAIVLAGSNFLLWAAGDSHASLVLQKALAPANADPFALHETTIGQLQDQMKKGTLTSEAITKLYLKRISTLR